MPKLEGKKLCEYLSQHDIIFETPSRSWESGLAIGNGNVGGLHYIPCSPGQMEWIVNKNDLWDMRNEISGNEDYFTTHECVVNSLKEGKNPPADSKKLCAVGQNTLKNAGKVRIGPFFDRLLEDDSSYFYYSTENITSESQRLCIGNALAKTFLSGWKGRYDNSKSVVTSFFHAEHNVLVIHVENPAQSPIEIYRWTDETWGYEPDIYSDEKHFGIGYTFPKVKSVWPEPYPALNNGLRYVMLGAIEGAPYKTAGYKNRAIANVQGSSDYTVYIAVMSSMDVEDPYKGAAELLDRFVSNGYEENLRTHCAWWEKYWEKSFINLPDKVVENLWYFGLYQLGSCSRSEPHTGIAGLWFGPDLIPGYYDGVAWEGAYTNDMNSTISHYLSFASNHMELIDSYIKTFGKIRPVAEAQTKKQFNMNGMCFPLATTPNGLDMASFPWRYVFIQSGLASLLFWMAFDYSGDKKLLETEVYPFVRSASEFFVEYMTKEKDDDGRYQLWPAIPSEQSRRGLFEKNPTGVLMMIKALLRKTLSYARELNTDTELCAKIEDLLALYPVYAQEGGYLLQSPDEPDPRFHRHSSRLEAGFHNAEFELDTPSAERDMIINTLRALSRSEFWDSEGECSWQIFYFAGTLARLGLGDELLKYFYGNAIPMYLKTNGFLACYSVSKPERQRRHESSQILLEGIGGLSNAITEMMLQSCNDTIRVFPCWPEKWRWSQSQFRDLRAEGAFLVSAIWDRGAVRSIRLKSLAGNKARIRNPWPGLKVSVTDETDSRAVTELEVGKDICFQSQKNHAYVIVGPGGKFDADYEMEDVGERAESPRLISCLDGSCSWLGRFNIWEMSALGLKHKSFNGMDTRA